MPPAPRSFPQFRRLVPELRRQIWDAALPEVDPPTVYDLDCCSDVFRPEKDAVVQAAMPELFFVNREARAAAWRWARDQGMEMGRAEGRGHHILTRKWDSERDLVYMSLDVTLKLERRLILKWELYAGGSDDSSDKFQATNIPPPRGPTIKHIAVRPDKSLTRLVGLMKDLPELATVNVIFGGMPPLETALEGCPKGCDRDHCEHVELFGKVPKRLELSKDTNRKNEGTDEGSGIRFCDMRELHGKLVSLLDPDETEPPFDRNSAEAPVRRWRYIFWEYDAQSARKMLALMYDWATAGGGSE